MNARRSTGLSLLFGTAGIGGILGILGLGGVLGLLAAAGCSTAPSTGKYVAKPAERPVAKVSHSYDLYEVIKSRKQWTGIAISRTGRMRGRPSTRERRMTPKEVSIWVCL